MATTTPQAPTPPGSDITPVTIEEEMRRSYLDYAMSVIVARALPDVRDGLKPVHRRILYSMKENGNDWNKAYRKSARVVGDVIGKYHPHGDSAIYEAMVRMAQDFSMRLPLIDGQGNFGSMDGDPAAAYRYTEARLARVTDHLLGDIDRDTVDYQDNYDGTEQEPVVLPAEFPNLLVNGAGGIAVGMATNIPPHNLGEVIDACCAYIDNDQITIDELIELVPGPDFPTGALIMGRTGSQEAARTGRGSVIMRAKTHIEEIRKDREAIIVTEIPFQVNKARMLERMAELVHEKVIEGISDLRDESDRDGVRMVIELKRDAVAEVVLAQLYKHTQLQTSFGVNTLALIGGRPEMLNLRQIIAAFVDFREEVITRRTIFLLGEARKRAHLLVGLAIAVANIDEIIELIRVSSDPAIARAELMARAWPVADVGPLIELIDEPGRAVEEGGFYHLSEVQARAILELRLQRLTAMERDKIGEELKELGEEIVDLLGVLGSRSRLMEIMRNELVAIKAQFANPRRTQIEASEFDHDIEDLIQREDMVVTVSHMGYIKRVKLSTYRAQRRGGKGRSGMATRDEDFVEQLFVANTHTPMLFFSTAGRAFELKVWRLPEGTPQSRGKPMVNMLPLQPGERIATVMPLPEPEERENLNVLFATSKGEVRRNLLSDFLNIKSNGKIAMKLEDEQGNSLGNLIAVMTCTDDQHALLATRAGKSIRFNVSDVRVFSGRSSTGVRGVRLAEGDEVISMSLLNPSLATPEQARDYLRIAVARRRLPDETSDIVETTPDDSENGEETSLGGTVDDALARLGEEMFAKLAEAEEFILSVTENGFGKRSSAYEYRTTGRGGQGIANMDITAKTGGIVASFPVKDTDQIMLVTDGGQLIRTPIRDVRIVSRRTQGVMLLRVDETERVVSVTRLEESGEDESAEGDLGEGQIIDGETPAEEGPGGEGEA